MDSLEDRERAASEACESRADLIIGMGVKDLRIAIRAAFNFGRSYGLTEANTILMESPLFGPKPPL